MALIAVIVGTATAAAATGRITPGLVVSGTILWSFVPVIQLLTGLLLIRGAAMSSGAALARYFHAHTAWSLWILGVAAVALVVPNALSWLFTALLTAAVPMLLTARRLTRLCRTDFGFAPTVARRRVVLHQAATMAAVLAYGEFAGGLLRRAIDFFR